MIVKNGWLLSHFFLNESVDDRGNKLVVNNFEVCFSFLYLIISMMIFVFKQELIFLKLFFEFIGSGVNRIGLMQIYCVLS